MPVESQQPAHAPHALPPPSDGPTTPASVVEGPPDAAPEPGAPPVAVVPPPPATPAVLPVPPAPFVAPPAPPVAWAPPVDWPPSPAAPQPSHVPYPLPSLLQVCAPDLPLGHAQVFVSPGVHPFPLPLLLSVDEQPAHENAAALVAASRETSFLNSSRSIMNHSLLVASSRIAPEGEMRPGLLLRKLRRLLGLHDVHRGEAHRRVRGRAL